MNISDSRFNALEHYSRKLADEIRKLMEHPDGLDPADFVIYDIEYLLDCLAILDEHGMAICYCTLEEAKAWRTTFVERFERFASPETYDKLLKSFDKFVKLCEDA